MEDRPSVANKATRNRSFKDVLDCLKKPFEENRYNGAKNRTNKNKSRRWGVLVNLGIPAYTSTLFASSFSSLPTSNRCLFKGIWNIKTTKAIEVTTNKIYIVFFNSDSDKFLIRKKDKG